MAWRVFAKYKTIATGLVMAAVVLLGTSLLAGTEIDLDSNTWWLKKGFSTEWTNMDKPSVNDGWISRSGGPLRIMDIFPEEKDSLRTYTIITSFTAAKATFALNAAVGRFRFCAINLLRIIRLLVPSSLSYPVVQNPGSILVAGTDYESRYQ